MTMSSCGEKSVSYRLNATRLPAATHPTTVASKHRAVSAYRHNTGRHPMWSLPGTMLEVAALRQLKSDAQSFRT